MNLDKSEKVLIGIFLLLSSAIILYNLFYIPSLPSADVVKRELVIQEDDSRSDEAKDKIKININSADIDDLKKIPGIGESTAQKIIDYREQNGGFSSKSEIMNIIGIGQKKFDSMKDYITI